MGPSQPLAPPRSGRARVILALAFALSLFASPVSAADAPPCRVGDEIVAYDGGRWDRVVVDTWWRLSSAYSPNDLVSIRRASLPGRGKVRGFVIDDLSAMVADARAQGVRLAVQSAYRSYRAQASTFREWVRKIGQERALMSSARAGHSEHQLGTAIDFKAPGGPVPWDRYPRWERTVTSRWLAANAWRYGFVQSYPKGTYETTCYLYEPWHYRYVGRDTARDIVSSGQTPRVWMLNHPTPSPSPTPTPTASPSPTGTPTAEPSVGA
jgi:D-alanyl-D-alanine carboxypeptidase